MTYFTYEEKEQMTDEDFFHYLETYYENENEYQFI